MSRLAAGDRVALVLPPGASAPAGIDRVMPAAGPWSSEAVAEVLAWFASGGADHLLWAFSPADLSAAGLRRLLACATDSGAALVYADFAERDAAGALRPHPLNDYQPGSLRDDFDFGPLVLLGRPALAGLEVTPGLAYGAWYDLRLRLSERGPLVHLPEPICTLGQGDPRASGEKVFDYVDPRNRDYQVEMERVASAHLERIGALLPEPASDPIDDGGPWPVEASVIIPVRNRARTVADAARSALRQKAPFDFNVIAVDNHSDDGTTDILTDLARDDPRLVHRVPARDDLGIGGCWNEAIDSPACGRIAVQLDSDDLYDGADVLARIVAAFAARPVAMVIGAYTIVDFELNPIPPGLIDHREWTAANGHNNALRVAGLGAPRAFHVPTLRRVGFPNVSYGEDYAVALRLCRQYRVGRIYDSLYWCRRWEDNTDAALSLETSNRYHAYKDRLRTIEIAARQRLVRGDG